MNKDPAFLFYSSDFLTGTMLMSNEEIGAYIKLMCLQHQQGHINKKDMINICNSSEIVISKFEKDKNGKYYNERLELETEKRSKYSESRRNNRLSKNKPKKDMINICKTYVEHMEDEDEDVNEDKDIYNYIEENYGRSMSSIEIQTIQKFSEIFTEDIIKYAIELSILNNAPKINYVKAILNNWKTSQYKTLEEIKKKETKIKESEVPEWFDKKIESKEASKEEQKEIDELLNKYK